LLQFLKLSLQILTLAPLLDHSLTQTHQLGRLNRRRYNRWGRYDRGCYILGCGIDCLDLRRSYIRLGGFFRGLGRRHRFEAPLFVTRTITDKTLN